MISKIKMYRIPLVLLKKWRTLLELYPCWLEEFAYLRNEVSRSDRHLEPLELNAARNHVVISKFKWKQK